MQKILTALTIIILNTFANRTEAMESHAFVYSTFKLYHYTSNFAPIKKTILNKSDSFSVKLDDSIAIPQEYKSPLIKGINSFPLVCMRKYLPAFSSLKQLKNLKITSESYPKIKIKNNKAFYALKKNLYIIETYKDDEAGQIKPISQKILFTYTHEHQKYQIVWTLDFVEFHQGKLNPNLQSKALPSRNLKLINRLRKK
jgi:hypothetical protein